MPASAQPASCSLKLVDRIGGEASTAVDRDSIMHGSQQGHQGKFENPRLEVPERRIDPGDCHRDNPRAAEVSNRGSHGRPCAGYVHGVPSAHDTREQVADECCRGRIRVRVTESGDSSRGDLDHNECGRVPLVGSVRLGSIRRHAVGADLHRFNRHTRVRRSAAHGWIIHRGAIYLTNSVTLSRNNVVAIRLPFGSPRASDSAR